MKPFERSSTANYSSKNMWKSVTGGILSTALLTSASFVNAQTECKLGDDSGVTVGFGIRTSYTGASGTMNISLLLKI